MTDRFQLLNAKVDALLRARIAGRRWIVNFDAAASATALVQLLRGYGAVDVMVLAGFAGTGPQPECRVELLRTGGDTVMESIRRYQRALSDVKPEDLDGFDPDRRAHILPTLFNDLETCGGRRTFGVRRPEWMALEDKLLAEALWDAVDVPRAEARVVPVEQEALRGAHAAMASPAGSVWSGDAREGWHGAAEYTRWVHDEATLTAASRFFASRCDRVRVMPFLEGQPCSIHGLVGAAGTVAALRPCEMVILRRAAQGRFHYAGAATTWDPPPEHRQQMRELARRVGAHLYTTMGYRGAFTLDGVMTREGFRPTEINPRFGAALIALTREISGFHIYLFNQLLLEGAGDELLPTVEHVVVAAADASRSGGGVAFVAKAPDRELEAGFRDEGVEGTLTFGPGPTGGFVRLALDAATVPAGAAVAPYAQRAFEQADREWGAGIGPMHAAPEIVDG